MANAKTEKRLAAEAEQELRRWCVERAMQWPVMPEYGWSTMTSGGGQSQKPAFGTGYIYRSASEIWLLGTRGAPTLRNRSTRNLIVAPRRQHSRKPDDMHAMIERQFRGPYLELFARRRRPGWDVWGNEVDKFSEAS